MNKLLTRDEFRKRVFERDKNKCVICKQDAQDAHHIIERRLFEDGGYYLDNGASLCGKHHIEAEQTILSCEEIRTAIAKNSGQIYVFPVLPDHWYELENQGYDREEYDKWGNIILPNGFRLKGELFYDESVQKILKEGSSFR